MSYQLLNPCSYSFDDLIKASEYPISLSKLYNISQKERNNIVKNMCDIAGRYYNDIKGTDGIVYTAFSPFILNK